MLLQALARNEYIPQYFHKYSNKNKFVKNSPPKNNNPQLRNSILYAIKYKRFAITQPSICEFLIPINFRNFPFSLLAISCYSSPARMFAQHRGNGENARNSLILLHTLYSVLVFQFSPL